MEIQRDISNSKNQQKIGETVKVIIDRKEASGWIGRSEADSPEVDQEIHFTAGKIKLSAGQFVQVKITDADDYDLMAELVL